MCNFFRQFFLLLTILLSYSSASAAEEPKSEALGDAIPTTIQVIDRVVATVDGEPLTLSDVRRHLTALGQGETLPSLPSDEDVRGPLNELIGTTLLLREAEAEGIAVGDDEIAAYIEEIQRQNGVDAAGFTELLQRQGLTQEQYTEQVRSDILRARVMSAQVRSKINILDEDIKRYLAERPDLVPAVGSQRVEQVVIPFPIADRESAESRLSAIRAKVEQGASLREAGGELYLDLGYVIAEELKEDLQEVLEKAPPNELTEPIALSGGLYLFKVSPPYSEAGDIDSTTKEEIRRELYERRFKEAVKEYVNVELPKKYHVEIKL